MSMTRVSGDPSITNASRPESDWQGNVNTSVVRWLLCPGEPNEQILESGVSARIRAAASQHQRHR